MKRLIKITNATKIYSKRSVLDNINIEIFEGESLGILGENGSGKTTLIEAITKLINLSSGEIEFDKEFNIQRDVGVQFQDGYWPKGVTPLGIIKYFSGYTKNIKNDKWKQELIDIFEVRKFLKKDLNNLSGGERQRLNALLAIVKNPKLIVLDELITGLDSKMQKKLSEFFKSVLDEDRTKTIITITHIPEEAEIFCDRIILLSNGSLIYDDLKVNIVKKFGSIRNFLNEYYDGKLVSNTKELNAEKEKVKYSEIIKSKFKNIFKKPKDYKFSPKESFFTLFKNIILLFISTSKNVRTYVFGFVIPIGLSLGLYFLSTYTQPALFPPSRVSGFLIMPCFAITLLMNTLISEWKASVFLKRIKISGSSKTQFLISIWLIGIVIGLLAFTANLCVYMGYGYTEVYGYDWIYQCLDALGVNGYIGLYLSAFLLTCMSMGISTIIAGAISNIGVTQSVSILLTTAFIATSDVFLPTTLIATSKYAVDICYINPTRYASWISIIMTNSANLNWSQNSWMIFNSDDALISAKYTYTFTTIWVPILCSMLWIISLFLISTFTFRWSNKK